MPLFAVLVVHPVSSALPLLGLRMSLFVHSVVVAANGHCRYSNRHDKQIPHPPLPVNVTALQVGFVFIWQRHECSILHLLLVLSDELLVDLDLRWCKSGCSNEDQALVADELPG